MEEKWQKKEKKVREYEYKCTALYIKMKQSFENKTWTQHGVTAKLRY